MTTTRLNPPLEYLQVASRASLQSFELARLNHAANLRAEIAALIDQWIQESSEAMLARWMLDHHQALQPQPAPPPDILHSVVNSSPANLLPDSTHPFISPAAPALTTSRASARSSVPSHSPISARPSVPPRSPNLVPASPRFAAPDASLPRRTQKQRQPATG